MLARLIIHGTRLMRDLDGVVNFEVGKKWPSGWSFATRAKDHATKYTSTNAAAPIDTCAAPRRASEAAPEFTCACVCRVSWSKHADINYYNEINIRLCHPDHTVQKIASRLQR